MHSSETNCKKGSGDTKCLEKARICDKLTSFWVRLVHCPARLAHPPLPEERGGYADSLEMCTRTRSHEITDCEMGTRTEPNRYRRACLAGVANLRSKISALRLSLTLGNL